MPWVVCGASVNDRFFLTQKLGKLCNLSKFCPNRPWPSPNGTWRLGLGQGRSGGGPSTSLPALQARGQGATSRLGPSQSRGAATPLPPAPTRAQHHRLHRELTHAASQFAIHSTWVLHRRPDQCRGRPGARVCLCVPEYEHKCARARLRAGTALHT